MSDTITVDVLYTIEGETWQTQVELPPPITDQTLEEAITGKLGIPGHVFEVFGHSRTDEVVSSDSDVEPPDPTATNDS